MLSQEKFNEIVTFFFTLQMINKVYHWNTISFARHKATDGFNNKILDLIDRFVEIFIGNYNMKPVVNNIYINDMYLSDDGIVELFIFTKKFLIKLDRYIDSSDLINIRDEMLSEVNQALYLFNLK
jgi:hypothetical protein